MLCLKRMRFFNEFIRDTVDDRIIGPGEYYYEDMDIETGKSTGLIISAEHYYEMKKSDIEANWDNSYLNKMESERDYKERLREQENALREKQVLSKIHLKEIM